jgi:hypothetical protein
VDILLLLLLVESISRRVGRQRDMEMEVLLGGALVAANAIRVVGKRGVLLLLASLGTK